MPTYDEAICIEAGEYRVQNNNCILVRDKNANSDCLTTGALFTEDEETSPLTPIRERCNIGEDETPPPSYMDALAAMTRNRETEYLLNGTNDANNNETEK